MFKPTLPSNDAARSLLDVQGMLAEAKIFSKALKKYSSSVSKFQRAADTLLNDSAGVVTTLPNKTTSIESIRAGLSNELDSGVHKPIAEWQGTYAAVKQEAKALAKLANVYGKNEASMHKAFEKRDKAGQIEGVKEAKLSKLSDAASNRATGYETAKVAYESAAPTVVTKCQSLLRQRDQLQISLFSTFAISGDALARMVTLRPDEVVGEQSGKLPTDVSLPYNNAITPTHTEGTPKEPSYAPPAYMYAPTTPSPTK